MIDDVSLSWVWANDVSLLLLKRVGVWAQKRRVVIVVVQTTRGRVQVCDDTSQPLSNTVVCVWRRDMLPSLKPARVCMRGAYRQDGGEWVKWAGRFMIACYVITPNIVYLYRKT